jgi:hypothetical protein
MMKCYFCSQQGHLKRNCPKRKHSTHQQHQKKDLSNITSHLCRKKGYYANKCPLQKNNNEDDLDKKSVTFESAHLTQTGEEQCHYICGFISNEKDDDDSIPSLRPRKYTDKDSLSSEDDSSISSEEDSIFCEGSQPNPYDHVSSHYHEEFAMAARANNNNRNQARRRLDFGAGDFQQGDFQMWLLDSGAPCHFTPVLEDLIDARRTDPPKYVRVADGTLMQATHEGSVELHFTSDQGNNTLLRLLRVLYIPGLQSRLF